MRRMRLSSGKSIDNFVPYETNLYEKIAETKWHPVERLIVDIVTRETIGYESKESTEDVSIRLADKPLSVRRMMALTGLKRMTAYRWIIRLVNRNILLQDWAYCPKKQFKLGMNFEFWQWDSKGDFIVRGEYIKLCDKATILLKEDCEKHGIMVNKSKRREQVDFKVLIGTHWYGAVVIVKTGWDGVNKIDVRIDNPKPNTYYFIFNKNLTAYEVIQPKEIEGQESKFARPVINTGYLDIPKENVGLKRINSNDFAVPPSPQRSEGDKYPLKIT